MVVNANTAKQRLSALNLIPSEITELKALLQEQSNPYLEQIVAHRIDQLKEEYSLLTGAILTLPSTIQSKILRMRYMEGNAWDVIAEETFYSRGGLHYQHNKAIKNVNAYLCNKKAPAI